MIKTANHQHIIQFLCACWDIIIINENYNNRAQRSQHPFFPIVGPNARQRERGRKAIVIMTIIRISVYCTGLHGLATTFSCLIFSVFFVHSFVSSLSYVEFCGFMERHDCFFYVLYLLCISIFFFVFLSLDFHVFLCFLSANIRTPFAIENFHYIENSYYNFSPN